MILKTIFTALALGLASFTTAMPANAMERGSKIPAPETCGGIIGEACTAGECIYPSSCDGVADCMGFCSVP